MNLKQQLFELWGLILGDGTFYFDRGKYPHMIFFNFNKNLVNYVKNICEGISKKKIKVSKRNRKTCIEYSFNIPIKITKLLMQLGFSKDRIPLDVINDKDSIFLLKGFYQSDGSYRDGDTRIITHQKNRQAILEACKMIANNHGLGAHIHNSSRRRSGEQFLTIENTEMFTKLFKKTVKKIEPKPIKKGNYHLMKRVILSAPSVDKWIPTSSIYLILRRKGIFISQRSNVLLNKHLNLLWKKGILEKKPSMVSRDGKGRFLKTECEWKLAKNLSGTERLNFPYGVLK